MSKVLTRCPGCTSKLRVPEVYLGKEISCPKCQGTVLVRDIEATESVPVATPRPVPKPVTPRAVAAPLKVAIPTTPQRVRKPAPINDVIEDFDEVSDDEIFEDLDEFNSPPAKSRGLKNQKKSRAVSFSDDDRPSRRRRKSSNGMNGGLMVKGALMIVGAIIWFVVGMAYGWIYYYPPVMLILGLIAFFKGMFGGDE